MAADELWIPFRGMNVHIKVIEPEGALLRRVFVLSSPVISTFNWRKILPEMNQAKAENASLIVTTFVHNHAGFQKDGTPDNELGNGWGCYDLGLQNENLILKAKELGYGTLIMGLRAGDKLREILSIPETETVMAVIAIGKAAEEPARPKRKDVEDIVRFY